jgi:hypothetical protein
MPWLFQFQRKRSEEEFEDTKGVIRILKSKDRQHMVKRKRTKGQTTIYKTSHITLKIK